MTDRRFRKAKTDFNWSEIDDLNIVGDRRRFKDRDLVEFEENGKLVRRMVSLETSSRVVGDGLSVTSILIERAFVKVNRKLVRVTEAPPMRVLDELGAMAHRLWGQEHGASVDE